VIKLKELDTAMGVRIDYKGMEIKFKDDMSLKEFDDMKLKFAIKNGVPNLSKPNWWYEKEPFSLFVLERLCLNCKIGQEFQIETKEEWREFYPLFKHYFPTMNEYIGIKNNVAFWNGRSDRVLEDSYYIKWVLLHRHGILNYGELTKMPFKEAMVLYYYAMLNNIFDRAEAYAQTAYNEARSQSEGEETNKIYR